MSLPEEERPYERLEKTGAQGLSDAELLAVILTSGTRNKTAVDLARNVLSLCRNGEIARLRELSQEELRSIDGIGRVKALQIAALCELSSRLGKKYRQRVDCSDSGELGQMLAEDMSTYTQEVFRTVVLDRKLKLIGMKDIFVGTVDMAPVHPREVFSEAVRRLGSYVVLAHNHPSGEIMPSNDDIKATKRLVLAGKMLEIKVLDHFIVGNGSFYSMHTEGDMERIEKEIGREIFKGSWT